MVTVIVGGVAGGMSAATRLRRLDEAAHIIVLERGEHVSFANCGLPYFAGGVIENREDLLLQTPESLKSRFNLDVRTRHEVVEIDPSSNTLKVKKISNGQFESIQYDNLILSLGAAPFIPPMEGHENLLTLRNVADVDVLVQKIHQAKKSDGKAIVVGAGFIGIEISENLTLQGLQVTLIELAPQVMPPIDKDMASYVTEELRAHGVEVMLSASVVSATKNSVTLSNGKILDADLIFASIGVRPEISLAKAAGIEIGTRGGVVVNSAMKTSIENIYAVGDMVEKFDVLSGEPSLVALANLANKQGRRAADAICGIPQNEKTNTALATAVVKAFDRTIAMTGASAKSLERQNREFTSIHTHPNDHAGYFPGAEQMHLVMHIDPITGEIFGAQGVGGHDVARRIDVLATAISGGLSAVDLIDLELAYAPQYGSAKDPVNMLGYIADGIINNKDLVVTPHDLDDQILVDVRTREEFEEGSIPGAINIDIDDLRQQHFELDKNKHIVVFCQVGQRGHSASRLLTQLGYSVSNLDGGYLTWKALQ
ncbi:MAG TPA: FAD-dependent oxidoreductase [Acidimicrobiia bacterium]|nr:FAD-dependent oxidoreductase [Acidimicrobiia bacterium]